MASFTLDGMTYEYLLPDPGHVDGTKSWEYGHRPKTMATVALAGGGNIEVYAMAQLWSPSHILASWDDDDRRPHWTWVPSGSVRRVTDSESDIWEYWRCPDNLRRVRWGSRLPGFLRPAIG